MRAVGPGVMTGWMARILWEVYLRTLASLTGGRLERPSRETVAERVAEEARGSRGAAVAHLAMMSERYLATTSAQRIAAHLRLVERLEEEVAATELFHYPDLGSTELVIVTKDVPASSPSSRALLAAEGINILSAQIHTRADAIALDTSVPRSTIPRRGR